MKWQAWAIAFLAGMIAAEVYERFHATDMCIVWAGFFAIGSLSILLHDWALGGDKTAEKPGSTKNV